MPWVSTSSCTVLLYVDSRSQYSSCTLLYYVDSVNQSVFLYSTLFCWFCGSVYLSVLYYNFQILRVNTASSLGLFSVDSRISTTCILILWILWESISLYTLLYFIDSMISTSFSTVLYSWDSVSQHIFLRWNVFYRFLESVHLLDYVYFFWRFSGSPIQYCLYPVYFMHQQSFQYSTGQHSFYTVLYTAVP